MIDVSHAAASNSQDCVWDYFQNDLCEVFAGSRERLRFLARRVAGSSSVLNIGVGAGIFEEEALRLGLNVFALDPSERSILRLRNEYRLGEQAQVGYAQAIPFASASFERVVISEVLEHIEPKLFDAVLSEIRRVLVPGGTLHGTVPARECLTNNLVVCPECQHPFHRWGHFQTFDRAGMRALLAPHFQVHTLVERPFVSWSSLNWKGKAGGLVKMMLWQAGIHGSNECLVFEARKASTV